MYLKTNDCLEPRYKSSTLLLLILLEASKSVLDYLTGIIIYAILSK